MAEDSSSSRSLMSGGWNLRSLEHVGDFLALSVPSAQGDSVKAGRGFLGAVPVGFCES